MSKFDWYEVRRRAGAEVRQATADMPQPEVGRLRRVLGGNYAQNGPRRVERVLNDGRIVHYTLFSDATSHGNNRAILWISNRRNDWHNAEGHRVSYESDASGLQSVLIQPDTMHNTVALGELGCNDGQTAFLGRLSTVSRVELELGEDPVFGVESGRYQYEPVTDRFSFVSQDAVRYSGSQRHEVLPEQLCRDDFLSILQGAVALIPRNTNTALV